MPRTEARVFTSIWRDEHFLALPASAQRLYMFLLSQDDLSYCGVMPLRPARWAKKAPDTSVADIEQDLKALETAGRMFVVVDTDSVELMVRTLLRRDGVWRQPNLLKQARESAEGVESPKIRAVLCRELQLLPLDETPSEQVRTLVADFIADLDQGTAYPSGNPDPDPLGNGSGDGTDDSSAEGSAEDDGDPTAKDHARAGGNSPSPYPLSPIPDPLFPVAPAALSRDRRNGTRLPDDYALTDGMRAWAGQNAPHVAADREFEQFRDYWQAKAGKDACKRDWLATWRRWMRTAEDRQGPRSRSSPRPGTPGPKVTYTDEEYQRGFRRTNA